VRQRAGRPRRRHALEAFGGGEQFTRVGEKLTQRDQERGRNTLAPRYILQAVERFATLARVPRQARSLEVGVRVARLGCRVPFE
jgi:hypothetical protein